MHPSEYKDELARAFFAACERAGLSPPADAPLLEKPRMAAHGDFCCPLALSMAGGANGKPRDIAAKIADALVRPAWVEDVQIAGAGFINVVLRKTAKTAIVGEILQRGEEFGRRGGRGETVLLEFVSANPTGPLHVGHGRACAYGDSLANILEARGFVVRREYYVNDCGRQMDILAASLWLRHWNIAPPKGMYEGDYLLPVAAKLADAFSGGGAPDDALREQLQTVCDAEIAAEKKKAEIEAEVKAQSDAKSKEKCKAKIKAVDDSLAALADGAADAAAAAVRAAVTTGQKFAALQKTICKIMMEEIITADMQSLGVNVGEVNFFYETSLHEGGLVERALKSLQKNGELKEEDGALWFCSSRRGDEKDRVIRRANGDLTYFAADIAYHRDKLMRKRPAGGYTLLNVLGADHHGYVPRLRAAVAALGGAAEMLEARIIQLVALYRDGVRARMSTRGGEFVSLQEVVDEIGADAARFFFVNRKNDKHLDFDLSVAKARNSDNPVYYIQYANARINGVFRKYGEGGGRADNNGGRADDSGGRADNGGGEKNFAAFAEAKTEVLAADDAAVNLCGALMDFPDTAERSAAERAPHLLAMHLHGVATMLHAWYEKTRMVDGAAEEVEARLALLLAAQVVLQSGAKLLGFSLPESL